MIYNLLPKESKSLVKKYLTRDVCKALEHATTANGFTLDKAIRSGIINPDSAIGIYAGDTESYKVFAAIFDPIIHAYHGISKGTRQTPDIHDVNLNDPDPEKKYILSTRIRVARNLKDFSFTSHIDLAHRKILEKKIVDALSKLEGDLKGNYTGFESPVKEKELLFAKGDRFQDGAGINSDFPRCRGVFCSVDKRLRVWVNEEDHMRIISQNASSDLSGVFNHLCKALVAFEQTLDFAKNDMYGYLSSCPTNIGTAMRAGVHIQLEKLNHKRAILSEITEAHDLQIRGTQGEKTSVDNSVFDISNRRRLGISEVEIVSNLHQGLVAIIEAEKSL